MLAGVLWATRRNLLVSLAFFAVAALVKAPSAILGAFCVLTILKLLPWRDGLRQGMLAALFGLALAAAAFGSVRGLASKDTSVRGGFPALVSAVRQALLGTYYMNSLHEIAFRIGRRLGGEDSHLADATIFFQGWWLKSKTHAALYPSPATNTAASPLMPGALVLVAAPQMNDDWAYVYDPAGRQRGFVRTAEVEETSEQPDAQSDPVLADLSLPLGQRALSLRVSLTIRLITWLVFGTAFFWLVSRTRNAAELQAKSLILLVIALYLVASWFWPWYILWALPLAAITPGGACPSQGAAGYARSIAVLGHSCCGPNANAATPEDGRAPVSVPRFARVARMLTIQLSFSVLLLYAFSDWAWTYSWRAMFVFGLPLLGTAITSLIARARRDSNARRN
jgi:hypothetical protein